VELNYYLSWARQIALGMRYLSEKRIIHGDLATRNVLMKEKNHVKITDFGLAKQLQNYNVYTKTKQVWKNLKINSGEIEVVEINEILQNLFILVQQPLPWKWLSPESLSHMKFSVKSDVWAFGVTVWEIYSAAADPYAGLKFDTEFAGLLESGMRLQKPKLATPAM
jgi:serine/threonine protein kinase